MQNFLSSAGDKDILKNTGNQTMFETSTKWRHISKYLLLCSTEENHTGLKQW